MSQDVIHITCIKNNFHKNIS